MSVITYGAWITLHWFVVGWCQLCFSNILMKVKINIVLNHNSFFSFFLFCVQWWYKHISLHCNLKEFRSVLFLSFKKQQAFPSYRQNDVTASSIDTETHVFHSFIFVKFYSASRVKKKHYKDHFDSLRRHKFNTCRQVFICHLSLLIWTLKVADFTIQMRCCHFFFLNQR